MKKPVFNIVSSALIYAYALEAIAKDFPLSITAESKENVAYLRITGAIYNWNNSAEEITQKIDEFLDAGITDVKVYLNGPGGDVFQAAEIENQIQRFPGSKTGTGGALIASAYTSIAASLDSFEMAENGQYMYHKPMGYFSGNEDKIKKELQLLKNLTSQYKSMYASKTGMSEDEIEASWKEGDVWLTAKEAVEKKFINGVIKKAPIDKATKAMIEACAAPTIPKVTNSQKHEDIMDKKILIALLGLPSDASDAQIEAAVKAGVEAVKTNASLTKAQKQKEEKEAKEKAETLVKAALASKKIKADQVENLTKWAESDYEACEAHLKSLSPLEKVSASVKGAAGGGGNGQPEKKFIDMTVEERDELANEDPETFRALYSQYLEEK